jgi:hypothetical protein
MVAVLAAGGFAWNRWTKVGEMRESASRREEDLRRAVRLACDRPELFGERGSSLNLKPLKALVQEAAAQCQVAIGFVSESEREVERDRQERQVMLRLVGTAHGNLVRFLGHLEKEGGGARLRELHLRPSKEVTDLYDEAEIVLVKALLSGGKP